MTAAQGTQLSKHMAIVAVAAMIGVMFAGSTLLTPLYIIYKQKFGFSDITLTLIYAAYVVGNLGALLVFGRLSDQIGRRRAALPALAVAVLSTLFFLFTDSIAALFWARALSGLGIGVAAGTGNAWLAESSARTRRAPPSFPPVLTFSGWRSARLSPGCWRNTHRGRCTYRSSSISPASSWSRG